MQIKVSDEQLNTVGAVIDALYKAYGVQAEPLVLSLRNIFREKKEETAQVDGKKSSKKKRVNNENS